MLFIFVAFYLLTYLLRYKVSSYEKLEYQNVVILGRMIATPPIWKRLNSELLVWEVFLVSKVGFYSRRNSLVDIFSFKSTVRCVFIWSTRLQRVKFSHVLGPLAQRSSLWQTGREAKGKKVPDKPFLLLSEISPGHTAYKLFSIGKCLVFHDKKV